MDNNYANILSVLAMVKNVQNHRHGDEDGTKNAQLPYGERVKQFYANHPQSADIEERRQAISNTALGLTAVGVTGLTWLDPEGSGGRRAHAQESTSFDELLKEGNPDYEEAAKEVEQAQNEDVDPALEQRRENQRQENRGSQQTFDQQTIDAAKGVGMAVGVEGGMEMLSVPVASKIAKFALLAGQAYLQSRQAKVDLQGAAQRGGTAHHLDKVVQEHLTQITEFHDMVTRRENGATGTWMLVYTCIRLIQILSNSDISPQTKGVKIDTLATYSLIHAGLMWWRKRREGGHLRDVFSFVDAAENQIDPKLTRRRGVAYGTRHPVTEGALEERGRALGMSGDPFDDEEATLTAFRPPDGMSQNLRQCAFVLNEFSHQLDAFYAEARHRVS